MSNYSYETSLPAYHSNVSEKKLQSETVLSLVKKGVNNLLELSQLTGLPQSTISARCNELIKDERIKYEGFIYYEDRKRKKIVVNWFK